MTHKATRHISSIKKQPVINNSQLSVIITAATMGKRMKSRGPKSLLQLQNNMTVLGSQLQTIWNVYPGCEIIVVVGFEANKIRNLIWSLSHPVRFIYNPLYDSTNVMYSIGLALQAVINNHIIILHGDLVFNNETITNLVGDQSKIVIENHNQINDEEIGVAHHNNQVTNLAYGINPKWCQIAYLTGKELSIFERITLNHNMSKDWFFYEGLKRTIEKDGVLKTHTSSQIRITEIDSIKDFERAKVMYHE